MATKTLVEFPLEAGEKLLHKADEEGLGITVAYWTYVEADEKWRLILSAPSVDREGPLTLVRATDKIVDEMSPDEREDLSILDVIVVSPHLRVIEDLRRQYGTVERHSDDTWYRSRRSEPYIYRLQ